MEGFADKETKAAQKVEIKSLTTYMDKLMNIWSNCFLLFFGQTRLKFSCLATMSTISFGVARMKLCCTVKHGSGSILMRA